MAGTNAFSFAVIALLALAGVPSAAHADRIDDLDVTMVVLDGPGDLQRALSKLRSPDDPDVEIGYWDYDAIDQRDEALEDELDIDFTMEDEFEEDRDFEEDKIDDEDDFEDGEDVDDDLFD
jgi:hypothetical protein